VGGLAVIIILGFFEFLRDDVTTEADRIILYSLIILVSVLVGATIVVEALRHFGKDSGGHGSTKQKREGRVDEKGDV
jgi:hypothetical protein